MKWKYIQDGTQRPYMNGVIWTPLKNTTVLKYVLANVTYPVSSNVFEIQTGDVVDLLSILI